MGISFAEALAYVCLPDVACRHEYLRGDLGRTACDISAKKIIAIGVPKELKELPPVVEDNSCSLKNGILLLLADLGDHRYLVHPGGTRGVNSVYAYHAEDIRLVTMKNPVPVLGLAAYPSSLTDVVRQSPRHSGLQVVALANCLAQI